MVIRAIGTLALLLVVSGAGAEGARQRSARSHPHATLRTELDGMTARLGGGRATARQAIADAQRLVIGYRTLVPMVRTFGRDDYVNNREIARHSLTWLARASLLYDSDPLAARAFLEAYDAIGGFYRDHGRFYAPGAYVAYAGAMRLAQRRTLDDPDIGWFAREAERYALAYGTMAALHGVFIVPWTEAADLPDAAPDQTLQPAAPPQPFALPDVDVSTLNPEQRQAWSDVRDRFRQVASRVHATRVLLDELSGRLQRQRMSLHPENAARALKMQSYLEEAVDLIRAGRFDTAFEALRRADYERGKLSSVTGQ